MAVRLGDIYGAPQLTQPEEAPGRIGSTLGGIAQGATSVASDLYGTAGELGQYAFGENAVTDRLLRTGRDLRDITRDVAPVNPEYQDDYVQQVATGVGQVGGMIATGGLVGLARGAAAGTAMAATSASLGASQGFMEGVRDYDRVAQEKGFELDEDDRILTGLANGVVATSESIPIAKAFKSLNTVTDGGWQKLFKKTFGNKLDQAAKMDASQFGRAARGVAGRKILAGTAMEATQEGLQTMAQDLIARDVIKYDPDRDMFVDAPNAAAVGGGVGMIINTITAGLGLRKARGQYSQMVEEQAVESGEPVDQVQEQVQESITERQEEALDKVKERLEEQGTILKTGLDNPKLSRVIDDAINLREAAYRSDVNPEEIGKSFKGVLEKLNEIKYKGSKEELAGDALVSKGAFESQKERVKTFIQGLKTDIQERAGEGPLFEGRPIAEEDFSVDTTDAQDEAKRENRFRLQQALLQKDLQPDLFGLKGEVPGDLLPRYGVEDTGPLPIEEMEVTPLVEEGGIDVTRESGITPDQDQYIEASPFGGTQQQFEAQDIIDRTDIETGQMDMFGQPPVPIQQIDIVGLGQAQRDESRLPETQLQLDLTGVAEGDIVTTKGKKPFVIRNALERRLKKEGIDGLYDVVEVPPPTGSKARTGYVARKKNLALVPYGESIKPVVLEGEFLGKGEGTGVVPRGEDLEGELSRGELAPYQTNPQIGVDPIEGELAPTPQQVEQQRALSSGAGRGVAPTGQVPVGAQEPPLEGEVMGGDLVPSQERRRIERAPIEGQVEQAALQNQIKLLERRQNLLESRPTPNPARLQENRARLEELYSRLNQSQQQALLTQQATANANQLRQDQTIIDEAAPRVVEGEDRGGGFPDIQQKQEEGGPQLEPVQQEGEVGADVVPEQPESPVEETSPITPNEGTTGDIQDSLALLDDLRGQLDDLEYRMIEGEISEALYSAKSRKLEKEIQAVEGSLALRERGEEINADNLLKSVEDAEKEADFEDLIEPEQEPGAPKKKPATVKEVAEEIRGEEDFTYEVPQEVLDSDLFADLYPKRDSTDPAVIQRLIEKFAAKIEKENPRIQFINPLVDEIPADLQENFDKMVRGQGRPGISLDDARIKALIHRTSEKDYVLINPATIGSSRKAVASIMHEVVGHYGVENVIGKGNFYTFTDNVWNKSNRQLKGAMFKTAVARGYIAPESQIDSISSDQARLVVREYIASLAEDYNAQKKDFNTWLNEQEKSDRNLIKRFLAFLTNKLKTFFDGKAVAKKDLMELVSASYIYVQAPKDAVGGKFDSKEGATNTLSLSLSGKTLQLHRGLKKGGTKRGYPGSFWTEDPALAKRYARDTGKVVKKSFTPEAVFDVDQINKWTPMKKQSLIRDLSAFMSNSGKNIEESYVYDVLKGETDFAYPIKEDVDFLKSKGYQAVRYEKEGGETVRSWFLFEADPVIQFMLEEVNSKKPGMPDNPVNIPDALRGAMKNGASVKDTVGMSKLTDQNFGELKRSGFVKTIEGMYQGFQKTKTFHKFARHLNPSASVPHPKVWRGLTQSAQGMNDLATKLSRLAEKDFKKMSLKQRRASMSYLKTKDASPDMIPGIDSETKSRIKAYKDTIEDLGQYLVDLGYLSKETFEKNRGAYVAQLYLSRRNSNLGGGKKLSPMDYLKQNMNLTEAQKKELGDLSDNPQVVIPSMLSMVGRDVGLMRFFDSVGQVNNDLYGNKKAGWILNDKPVFLIDPNDGRSIKYKDILAIEKELQELRTVIASKDIPHTDRELLALENKRRALEGAVEQEAVRLQNEVAEAYSEVDPSLVNASDKQKKELFDDLYQTIPNKAQFGSLAGRVVRKSIYDDIVGITESTQGDDQAFFGKLIQEGGVLESSNRVWKQHKILFNPPSYFRNAVGGFFQLDIGSRSNTLLLMKDSTSSLYDIVVKGKMDDWSLWSHEYGLWGNTMTATELYSLHENLDNAAKKDLEEARGDVHRAKRFGFSLIGAHMKAAKWAGDIYGGMEGWLKTVAFKDYVRNWASDPQRDANGNVIKSAAGRPIPRWDGQGSLEGFMKSLPTQERMAVFSKATQEANKAIFDYKDIPVWLQYLRRAPFGAPFLTWTYKSFPAMIRGAVYNPQKFIKYMALPYIMMQAALTTGDFTEDELEEFFDNAPRWMREKGSIYVLPYKDENGKVQAVDMGYFYLWDPWMSLAKNTHMNWDSGNMAYSALSSVGKLIKTTGVFEGPIPSTWEALMNNYDTFSEREVTDLGQPKSDQLLDKMAWLYTMWMPTYLTEYSHLNHIGENAGFWGDQYTAYGTDKETAKQAALKGWLNIYGVDPQESRRSNLKQLSGEIMGIERNRKKALRNPNLTSPEERAKVMRDYAQRLRSAREARERYLSGEGF